jgi:peptide chain release factor 1
VLDYPSEQAIEILDKDLTIEWFSGTGPGGQNRNKVMASCRLRHTPTGVVVTAQTRSRVTSLAQAKQELTARIQASVKTQAHRDTSEIRKQQVGSGQRGDKIRTIQLQHDSAVDHRTGKRCSAESYLKGDCYKLWS